MRGNCRYFPRHEKIMTFVKMNFKWPLKRFTIEGRSMLPMFQPGDRVLIWRWGSIREGDIIVFKKDGMTLMKEAVRKEHFETSRENKWFCRAENPSEGLDSLDFGLVPEKSIVGKVITKY